jgi:hypothetical protein
MVERHLREDGMTNVYTITLERLSTGERAASMLLRVATEAEARQAAERAIAGDRDLRVVEIRSRKQ